MRLVLASCAKGRFGNHIRGRARSDIREHISKPSDRTWAVLPTIVLTSWVLMSEAPHFSICQAFTPDVLQAEQGDASHSTKIPPSRAERHPSSRRSYSPRAQGLKRIWGRASSVSYYSVLRASRPVQGSDRAFFLRKDSFSRSRIVASCRGGAVGAKRNGTGFVVSHISHKCRGTRIVTAESDACGYRVRGWACQELSNASKR